MKKNLYLLMALLFSCSLIFSCSDSDDDGPDGPDGPDPEEVVGPDVDGTYNNGSNLVLTYSGSVLLGEQTVVFAAASDKETATITLNGVFPGVASVTLSNVELEATETQYTFGPAEASSNGWSFTYSGTVEEEGDMTVALTSIQMPTHDLLGTWTLDEDTPLFINWESGEKFTDFLSTQTIAGILPSLFSDQLVGVLQSVSFREDGNITAIYSAEAQSSPINMAQYYVEDGHVKILLNISAIMGAVMGNLTAGDGGFDFTELLPLIEQFADLINNGIPLAYTTEGEVLTVTLETEVLLPLVSVLLENETIYQLLSSLTIPGLNVSVSLLLPQLPAVLGATTVLEAGLIMNSAE
ncbi:MAG: DUF4925 domain-containing protein [Bacteroides sp.]|nr:DUF4925 domain-containing protein [Bacteroides sp.]